MSPELLIGSITLFALAIFLGVELITKVPATLPEMPPYCPPTAPVAAGMARLASPFNTLGVSSFFVAFTADFATF